MPACAVMNELSFTRRGGGEVVGDRELVRRLATTLLALRAAVTAHDRSRVVFVGPGTLGSRTLPGGATFSAALSTLRDRNPLLAELLLLAVADGPWFDDDAQPTWRIDNSPARGLAEAHERQGLAISFDLRPWRTSVLRVKRDKAGVETTADVANAWQETVEDPHRSVLRRHVAVLPEYENPGTHDPGSPHYVAGKSHLPRNARRVLDHAIPVPGHEDTWWARCEHEFFHRFSGALRGARHVVHWNATTNTNASQATREDDVPGVVRRRLEELRPARDCGCVELQP
jgi:hypothetical protein